MIDKNSVYMNNPLRQNFFRGGKASNSDVGALRAAGFSDGDIAEIIAHIALNIFTNYYNIAEVDVDFPRIALRQSA